MHKCTYGKTIEGSLLPKAFAAPLHLALVITSADSPTSRRKEFGGCILGISMVLRLGELDGSLEAIFAEELLCRFEICLSWLRLQ